MTVEVISYTRDQLVERRRAILATISGGDEAELRRRAEDHSITPEERDTLNELEEVDFLLGDDG